MCNDILYREYPLRSVRPLDNYTSCGLGIRNQDLVRMLGVMSGFLTQVRAIIPVNKLPISMDTSSTGQRRVVFQPKARQDSNRKPSLFQRAPLISARPPCTSACLYTLPAFDVREKQKEGEGGA